MMSMNHRFKTDNMAKITIDLKRRMSFVSQFYEAPYVKFIDIFGSSIDIGS